MKLRKRLIILLVFLIATNIVFSQEPDWQVKIKTIKPLFSTRDDVIRVFGQPMGKEKRSYGEEYDLEEGRMSVIYTTGLCIRKIEDGLEVVNGWNVPEWTVFLIIFSPTNRISPKRLNINFDNFRSEKISDVPGAVSYENDETGVGYTVYKGKIETISFQAPNKYDYLQCK
jgi:hypothetical protein